MRNAGWRWGSQDGGYKGREGRETGDREIVGQRERDRGENETDR